jgi:DUF4097 and DUF4098 domain-containing protein YvlB
MHHEFGATGPQKVHVELQSGDVDVETTEDQVLTVDIDGDGAEEVRVERTEAGVEVVGPRRTGFLSSSPDFRVRLRVPVDSDLTTRLGSAGVTTRGRLGAVRLASGSGDVEVDEVRSASVKTGSGDISVGTVSDDADLKAGSGDVRVRAVGHAARIVTGSGSIEIREGRGALSLKSGSGDLVVASVSGDTSLFTASGDLTVGRVDRGKLQLRNVSGDIRLGVPAGTPVWTDVSTTTGRVHSSLPPVGPPSDGQEHVEVRASSVSGDIHLVQA